MTHLDGVVEELLGAVAAGLGALRTLGQHVLREQPAHHARPTLVLAVGALLGADPLVVLEREGRGEEIGERAE